MTIDGVDVQLDCVESAFFRQGCALKLLHGEIDVAAAFLRMLVILVGQKACWACVGFRSSISLLAGTDVISLSLSLDYIDVPHIVLRDRGLSDYSCNMLIGMRRHQEPC